MICEIFSKVENRCVVLQIGDWYDFASLSSYERPGSKSFENRRYIDDLDAGMQAQLLVWEEIKNHNRHRRGDSILKIDWHWLQGNHEHRLTRAVETDPQRLSGVISLDDLTEPSPIPWTVHPFLRPVFLNEVGFSHFWAQGVMGRGPSSAASLLRKQQMSVVQGHSHLLDYHENTSASGRRLSGLICGCFFTHTEGMEWAGPQVRQMWRPGIAVLHGVENGEFDFQWVSYRRILADYSD
jgi:hypothetical protein